MKLEPLPPVRKAVTPREHEIMQLSAEGLSAKAVAAKLGISVKTVETYRMLLYRKLGARNLVHCLALMRDMGLLRVPS